MTSPNKEAFLKRLSEKLGRSEPEHTVSCNAIDTRPLDAYDARLCRKAPLTQFEASCLERGTRLERCSLDELETCLTQVIADWGGGKIGVPESSQWSRYGLADFLETPGLQIVPWDPEQERSENIRRFEATQIGITFPLGAVADTGMILQQADRVQGRSISLLPQAHIAIVPIQSLYATLSEAFAAHLQADAHRYSQLVCIAGPSSTGDIENNIVQGVHGPMYECVILVEGASTN